MDVPLLLAAVSQHSPCGEDLEYDAEFLQLERDAQGKPERTMGDAVQPAEPPEWRGIELSCTALLQRSKDLRITHYLVQSALALDGISGLANTLKLIRELLTQYWADLHPQLDADDDNDPTVRVNTLSGLACDANVRLLREAVLVRSRVFGSITLRAALNASGLQPFSEETLGSEELTGALQDADGDALHQTREALAEALQAAQDIERYVSEQVGSAQGVDLSALRQPLKLALQAMGESAAAEHAARIASTQVADVTESLASLPAAAAVSRPAGEIANRDDVLKSLDRILGYYARQEPSSPLPVLLNRARTLVNADFATIVRNLIPDGMSQFENLRGPDADQS